MIEPSTATLIIDMRQMHVDGAGNDQLCSRGTEIYERLEKDTALAGADARKQGVVLAEWKAFEKIVENIRRGRGDKALEAYDKHVASRIQQSKTLSLSKKKKGINLLKKIRP